MLTDSIITNKVDTLMLMTRDLSQEVQCQLARIDSSHITISQITQNQAELNTSLDTISSQLNTIANYGVGYSDVAAHIAIPLIIALFAFAFPFLFTIISHINNKYESEHITKMFSSESSYKWFLRGAIISAAYLIIVGVSSLCLKGLGYHWLMHVLNWSSIVVAGSYSFFIIRFVYMCLDYNNPQKIFDRIDKHFDRGSKKAARNIKKYDRKKSRINKIKKSGKRKFQLQKLYLNRNYAHGDAEGNRMLRLTDLCKYALKKQDYSLFQNVITNVGDINHSENGYEYLDFKFYENVVEAYLFTPQNAKVEDVLMLYWFTSFKKSQIPNLGAISGMLEKVMSAVRSERISLFENYLHGAKYGYHFILSASNVAYVRGMDEEVQKQVSNEQREAWSEIKEMHFIALAHLLSLGYTEIIRIIESGDNLRQGRLLPGTGPEVLKIYAQCKEKQIDDGRFRYGLHADIVGDNPVPDMLEKFTAVLLLLVLDEGCDELKLISPNQLDIIKKNQEKICKYANLWKENNSVVNDFLGNKKIEIDELYNANLKCFEDGADVFQKRVPQKVKESIKTGYWTVLYGNQGRITDNLVGEQSERKTESILMGIYTYITPKISLFDSEHLEEYKLLFGESRVFASRYLFIFYSALHNMKMTENEVEVEDLVDVITDYLGSRGSDYVVIETGSSSRLMMELDKNNGRNWFDRKFKGADYKHFDLRIGWYLSDIEEIESFNETVVIIKKNDLPFVESTVTPGEPDVSFAEESDMKKGYAYVRLTINPNLIAKYSKDAEVVRLKIVSKGMNR